MNLKEVRKNISGKYSNAVAKDLGISRRTLTRWEKGLRKELNNNEKIKLANSLGVSIEVIDEAWRNTKSEANS